MDDMTEDAKGFHEHYRQIRPRYGKLVDEVMFALMEYVQSAEIETSEVLGRAKSMKSFAEKVSRKAYQSPLSEMNDLAAVRVVCLFEADLEKVKDLILENFEVVELEDKSEGLGDSLMGYQGFHLIVRLGSKFQGPRYDELKDLICEIQVRTVLQDAWSKISHKLVYKSEASVPKPLRRSLNNVSALMEIAQSVFDTVKTEQEIYTNELRRTVDSKDGLFSQEVNHHTLLEYSRQKFGNLQVSDYWHDHLIADLDILRYKTIRDIDNVVDEALPYITEFAKQSPERFEYSTDWLTKSLGLLDADFAQVHGFTSSTLAALDRLRQKYDVG